MILATYTYQEYPVTKLLGECVDLKAKAFYRKTNGTTNAKTRVIVQWKKDTRSITDNGRISVSDGRLTLFEEGLR